MSPKYLSREDVPAEVVAAEQRIAEETAIEEGKPEQAITKIVEGRTKGITTGTSAWSSNHGCATTRRPSVPTWEENGVKVIKFARFKVGQN